MLFITLELVDRTLSRAHGVGPCRICENTSRYSRKEKATRIALWLAIAIARVGKEANLIT